ncbi:MULTISPECIES: JAB domain-containing protein [Pediococcus]|jgi:DNA repair protein RadC|uniref:DNA repair protein n=2 Tax=Pediococcus parvulus TaxID=54062 RepID=A0AAP5WAT2_9LACO|nr:MULTISPECIES: JAB domain-containing protein [Pediococcus]MCT3027490.1 DNA repair protein [Pediococcus parvulus]MCT3029689.1 DNA repair protein [Pediococcus parvulus]MCT3030499.1 DNA repair protein [Pediococcus parvulus]MCT3035609.1 DNA repair protein [Pediococcus parvulus]MDV7693473.1 DNA repair protein [Pediococcus parvulus]
MKNDMQTTQIEVARKPFDEMAQYTNEELLQVFLTDKLPINEQRQVLADFWKLIPDLSLFSLLYNPEKKQIFADYPELNRQFLACVELGRRIELAPQKIIGEIFGSRQIGERLIHMQRRYRQERLTLLCLNTKNKIVFEKMIFKGSLNSATVHPREIFFEALRVGANKIMVTHNHPSGDVSPSQQDIQFTKRLKDCGILMGIEVLDHIITGSMTYYSFAEQHLI